MKRLTLIRHAKSSWKDPRLPDFERPLSRRGERDAPRMGRRLLARGAQPKLIVTSEARRALMTAEIIADLLSLPRQALRREAALYLADVDTLFDVIAAQDDGLSDLMLVAHNPGLTDLANELLPGLALDNLPTTGVVAMACSIDRWPELERGVSSLLFYDYPKA